MSGRFFRTVRRENGRVACLGRGQRRLIATPAQRLGGPV